MTRFDKLIPVVSHIEVSLQYKYTTPNNFGEALKGPQRKLWKEALFLKYENNKNDNILSDPIPIN